MPPPDHHDVEGLLAHLDWTRRLALALARDPSRADDLTQETWLSFLRSPPPASRPLRPWLARVMRNAARERGRRERTRTGHETAAARERERDGDDELVERLDRHRALVEEVAALEPRYRRVVLWRYFDGLTAAEIAEREGVPQATVRTWLRRGLEQLRERLERKSGDWRAALLPLLPPGSSKALLGASVMGAKGVLLAVVGVLLIVLGVLGWDAFRGPEAELERAAVASPTSWGSSA